MNSLKIIGIVLIIVSAIGLLNVIADYTSGKIGFWPFGVEIGAGLMIALGIFLIRRGNRHRDKLQ